MTTYTITEALAELKTLGKRLEKNSRGNHAERLESTSQLAAVPLRQRERAASSAD